MASVKQRGSSSWLVRWRCGRTDPWKNATFPDETLAAAAKLLAEAHQHRISAADVYRAVFGDPEAEAGSAPTLAEWIERWINAKVDIAENTKKEYARLLRCHVVAQMGRLRLTEITREIHIREFITWLVDRGLAPATVRKHYAVLHEVLRDAVGVHIESNPAEKPKNQRSNGLPKIKRYPAVYLSEHEAQLLIAACGPTLRDLVIVALGTGMRLGELLGLRAGDVDLSAGVVYVEQTLHKDGTFGAPKSERSERAISLTASVIEVLRRLVAGKKAGELVFTTASGHAWLSNNLRRRFWRLAVAKAGRCAEHPPPTVRVRGRAGERRVDPLAVSTCACPGRLQKRPRIHDLRHTHVGWLIEAGWDFYAIQRRVGHASIKTTFDVYGHRLPGGDAEALAALDAVLCGTRSGAAAVAPDVPAEGGAAAMAEPEVPAGQQDHADARPVVVERGADVLVLPTSVSGVTASVERPASALPTMVFLAPPAGLYEADPDDELLDAVDADLLDADDEFDDDEDQVATADWELNDLLAAA